MKDTFFYFVFATIGVITFYFHWKFIVQPIHAKVCRIKRGVVTSAKVVYFIDTLARIQNRPLVHVVLNFNINGSTTSTDKLKILIKTHDLIKYKIGVNVLIKYDPKNLKNIEILSVIDVPSPI